MEMKRMEANEQDLEKIFNYRLILRMLRALAVAESTEQSLEEGCLDVLMEQGIFRAAVLFRLNRQCNRLELISSRGMDPNTISAGSELPVHGSLTGQVIERGQIITAFDVAHDDRVSEKVRESLNGGAPRVVLSIPLIIYNRPTGALNLFWDQMSVLSAAHQEVLMSMGHVLAAAMEHTTREYEALHDALTGLLNRREFEHCLTNLIAISDRYANYFSIIWIDIDNFKRCNDEHGHLSGDLLLQNLARVLKQSLRISDVVFRCGGEEFAVLLPETDQAAAAELAERLRAHFSNYEHIDANGHRYRSSISLGVAQYVIAEGRESFLRRADAALYAAKDGGRNRVEIAER